MKKSKWKLASLDKAVGNDEEYVISAIKAGYQTLGFSDHIMLPDLNRNYEYFDSIGLLKEKYKNQIDILTGYEVEYLPGQEENLFKLKRSFLEYKYTLLKDMDLLDVESEIVSEVEEIENDFDGYNINVYHTWGIKKTTINS